MTVSNIDRQLETIKDLEARKEDLLKKIESFNMVIAILRSELPLSLDLPKPIAVEQEKKPALTNNETTLQQGSYSVKTVVSGNNLKHDTINYINSLEKFVPAADIVKALDAKYGKENKEAFKAQVSSLISLLKREGKAVSIFTGQLRDTLWGKPEFVNNGEIVLDGYSGYVVKD